MMAMELEMEARNPSGAAFRDQPQSDLGRHLAWVLSFAVPGLGMFTEGTVLNPITWRPDSPMFASLFLVCLNAQLSFAVPGLGMFTEGASLRRI